MKKTDIGKHSYMYHKIHGISDSDVKKANILRKLIESSRGLIPSIGDIMICRGPGGVEYQNGHVDRDMSEYSAICVRPSYPFVFSDGSNISLSTSGGYWFSIPKDKQKNIKYIEKRIKLFKTWGHCGACGDGAFTFEAEVNVWEIYLDSIY